MSLWRRVLAERRGLVVPLLAALAINIGVLALGVFPLQASVTTAEGRARSAKSQLAEAQRLEKLANDTRTSQQRADLELKKFYSEVLPTSHAAARDLLYQELRAISGQAGLTFTSSSFEPEPVEASTLTRLYVDVRLTGDYANIRRFIYDVETTEEFFIIESIKLGPTGRKDAGGSLEVVLRMLTYYQEAQR